MHLQAGILLLVHGEVTSPEVDMFDREAVFIETVLEPLLAQVPGLRVVLEHITTEQAVKFVAAAPDNVAATVTPQHMLYNRNALFQVGPQGCKSAYSCVSATVAMPQCCLHVAGGLLFLWQCHNAACMRQGSPTGNALTLLAYVAVRPSASLAMQ